MFAEKREFLIGRFLPYKLGIETPAEKPSQRRRSGASRTTKKVTSIPLKLPANCPERGRGVVEVVVVVGFGSSLQQVLASVEFPLGGQQKLP